MKESFLVALIGLSTQIAWANEFFQSDSLQKTKEFIQIGQADLFAMADAL